ncbi:MAG: hypothetical protein ACM33T_00235 [Solirubrobacterales bacterium]
MPDQKRFSLGGSVLPIDIDAIESLPATGGVIVFDFTYRGIRFGVRCEETGEGTARLKAVGDVGRVPFSAEAPAARAGLSAIILHGNDLLGQTFRLVDGRILLGGERILALPVTATRLVTALAEILIPAAPYLDLCDVYLAPDGSLRPEWRRPARPVAPAYC